MKTNIIMFVMSCFLIAPALAELPIKIKQGMQYAEARNILLNSGWQTTFANTTPNGTPLCHDATDEDEGSCDGQYEIEECSGTGMGFCLMSFYDGEGTYLSIVTAGGPPSADNKEVYIREWHKIKKEDETN